MIKRLQEAHLCSVLYSFRKLKRMPQKHSCQMVSMMLSMFLRKSSVWVSLRMPHRGQVMRTGFLRKFSRLCSCRIPSIPDSMILSFPSFLESNESPNNCSIRLLKYLFRLCRNTPCLLFDSKNELKREGFRQLAYSTESLSSITSIVSSINITYGTLDEAVRLNCVFDADGLRIRRALSVGSNSSFTTLMSNTASGLLGSDSSILLPAVFPAVVTEGLVTFSRFVFMSNVFFDLTTWSFKNGLLVSSFSFPASQNERLRWN